MDPTLVDVNVHPAKREVRFAEPAQVRMAIMSAVEEALRPKTVEAAVDVQPRAEVKTEVVDGVQRVVREPFSDPSVTRPTSAVESASPVSSPRWHHEEQVELPVEEAQAVTKTPGFRVVGALSDRYALLEGEEGLVLLEPRAARERIYYESLINGEEVIESQGLLVPVLLELDSRDIDFLMRHREHFDQAGFTLESFGGQTVTISSVPSFLESGDPKRALIDLVDLVLDRDGGSRVKKLAYEGFSAKVVKIAAGQESWNVASLKGILDDLFLCDLPYCDPAGRPTLVQISYQELDRKFGKS